MWFGGLDLFLLVYACCNLDDRSWWAHVFCLAELRGGERKAGSLWCNQVCAQCVGGGSSPLCRGTRVDAEGNSGKRRALEGDWTVALLRGCGQHPTEPLIHFLGRALCCRPWTDPDYLRLEAASDKKDKARRPLTWQIQRRLNERAEAHYTVICMPVEGLLAALRMVGTATSPPCDELLAHFKKALAACPALLESKADWTRFWSPELEVGLRLRSVQPTEGDLALMAG